MKALFYGLAGFERTADIDPGKTSYYFAVNDTLAHQMFHHGSEYPVPDVANMKKLRFEYVGNMPVYKFMGLE